MPITRRALLQSMAAAGVGAVVGRGGYGALYERHALRLESRDVSIEGLPQALDGVRIGLMTDIHRGPWVSHEDVAGACAHLMSAAPDLIVLGGDYVTWGERAYIGPAAEALAGLHAPHGVYAILGNHDDERDVPAALATEGITVLRDQRTLLRIRSEALELAGIRFWTRKPADITAVLRGATGTLVLLAHDPRRVAEAAALGVPLVLSGHTHGGQIVLPGLGAVAARKFPVVAGLKNYERTTLFVSRGIGTVYIPVRVNCPPDVAVLTLRHGASASAAAIS